MEILYKSRHSDTYRDAENFYYRNNVTNISSNVKYFQVDNNYVENKEHYDFDLRVGIKLTFTYK